MRPEPRPSLAYSRTRIRHYRTSEQERTFAAFIQALKDRDEREVVRLRGVLAELNERDCNA